jgi:chromosome segregation ATPase
MNAAVQEAAASAVTATTVAVAQATQGAAPQLVSNASEVGTIAAVLVAAAVAFAKFAPKLGLERKEAQAEESLIANLSSRIDVLTVQFASLQADRDSLFKEHALMSARMSEVESLEQDNQDLRESLKRRDEQNQQLIDDILRKNQELSDMERRLHQMELRLAQQAHVCEKCQAPLNLQV